MTSGGPAAASQECSNKVPAGGFLLVPPPEAGQYQFALYRAAAGSPGGLSALYALHTLVAQKGDIYITRRNVRRDQQPRTCEAPLWLDCGGPAPHDRPPVHVADNRGHRRVLRDTGQRYGFGNGGNTFPWINHTEQGTVWFARATR